MLSTDRSIVQRQKRVQWEGDSVTLGDLVNSQYRQLCWGSPGIIFITATYTTDRRSRLKAVHGGLAIIISAGLSEYVPGFQADLQTGV